MTGVPQLDDLAGDWLPREALAHLPSLRNQWGQAHVNADLTSLSWLAIPPYSGGYHTGVLRVDARVLPATSMRWFPWGVQRRAATEALEVTTDTRLGYAAADVRWQVSVRNTSAIDIASTVEQELLGPIAVSEIDWGWLYGTPWNAGHHHDYFTTERIRAEVLADAPRQVHLVAPEERYIRLGSPRIPGIQRDEDTAPMLLVSELPDHSASDSGRVRAPAARGTVRGIAVGGIPLDSGEYLLAYDGAEYRLAPVALADGAMLSVEFRPAHAEGDGVVLTHGNHPDSVQFGVSAGRPWLRVAGERVCGARPLTPHEWHRIEVRTGRYGAELHVDGEQVASTRPWWSDTRWLAQLKLDGVLIEDSASPACCGYAFATPPDEIVLDGARAFARWDLCLAPGETVSLGTVAVLGSSDDTSSAAMTAAARLAQDFDDSLADVARRWRDTWTAAFTPGNAEFSGYLPTLVTDDAGLGRTYYLGALLAIYLRNTEVSPIGAVFLTGGPRLGPTTTFYWDQSEWARTAAMLEPVGMRSWILAALAQPYERSHSFDTRNLLPIGNHYAANDHALFRIVQAYVGVTADLGLLAEKAGERTVLDHLRAMAYRPRSRRAVFADGVLVDLGSDPWELLECVPNYRDAVVAFNAGYVGMLRDLAVLLTRLGESVEAARARADAAGLADAVLRQYAGDGRWRIAHPTGTDTIGHVLDFVLVAADMSDDLTEEQRAELVAFVLDHLLDGDWMRALDPADPIAPYSDRPDHGAAGAFGAWPGATAYGLCRLGRPDAAQRLLGRIHAATSGGLWGQAMESVGGGRFRVAERGASNRDANAGVAVCEAVLGGLFAITADYASLAKPVGTLTAPAGRLWNVNAHGFDIGFVGDTLDESAAWR